MRGFNKGVMMAWRGGGDVLGCIWRWGRPGCGATVGCYLVECWMCGGLQWVDCRKQERRGAQMGSVAGHGVAEDGDGLGSVAAGIGLRRGCGSAWGNRPGGWRQS